VYSKKDTFHVLVLMSIVHIIMTVFLWWDHDDYRIYFVEIWEDFIHGHVNYTYPIGFVILFAPLYKIWFKLPKLAFILAFIVGCFQFYRFIFNSKMFKGVSNKAKFYAVMTLILSPICAIKLWGGYFDGIIGLFILNIYFVLRNRGKKPVFREIKLLLLIFLTIAIKFVGIFLIIPYIFHDLRYTLKNEDDRVSLLGFKLSTKKLVILKLFSLIGLGGCVLAIGVRLFGLETLIEPFLVHSRRDYITVFNHYKLPLEPFYFGFFTWLYSSIGLFLFVGVLLIVYLYCIKKRVSTAAWLLLPVLTFLAFFPVSNSQFILWLVFLFGIYYLKERHDPNLTKKFIAFQLIAFLIHFFVPFAQFFYLYFMLDIIKKEKQMKNDSKKTVVVNITP